MSVVGPPSPVRYIKFDTFHPAVSKGLPVTRVISRVTLQEILARGVERYGGEGIVRNGCTVEAFEERVNAATGSTEVGRDVGGRLLSCPDVICYCSRQVALAKVMLASGAGIDSCW